MNDVVRQLTEPFNRRGGTRLRHPNRTLDLEGVRCERLRKKKNARSGYLSNVTAKVNEIIGLLSDERNLLEVKEKLVQVEGAFERLCEAHQEYASEIQDADGVAECQQYLCEEEKKFNTFRRQIVNWITETENNLLTVSRQVDSDVKPEDSVSCSGMPTPSGVSKTSKNPSRARSRSSRASSVAFARAKEAAKVAELRAEIRMLEKRQALEEKKFRLKQEKSLLNLEDEIAKITANERAFAAMTTPELNPVKLEQKFNDQDDVTSSLENKSSAGERIHYGDQGHTSNWIPRDLPDSSTDFTASEN